MSENKSVYIGNIPYDYTEEQVLEIAKSVAPVLDLKLLFDPLTGKSRGYAFIKYGDHESAASAVRNLNNLSIGNRTLRCSFSNDNSTFSESTGGEKLPALPHGVSLFSNQSLTQAITSSLSRIDKNSALKLMKEAKEMCLENPALMKTLLDEHPQLSHALVEICLLLNLTQPEVVKACVNPKQLELQEVSPDHVMLLRQVKRMSAEEIGLLEPAKQDIIKQLKAKITEGAYGVI